MRGRIGAIEWWIEKTEAALGRVKPEAIDAETLTEITTSLGKIDTLLNGYLPDPPVLRPIQRIIEMIPSKTEKIRDVQSDQTQQTPQPQPQPQATQQTQLPLQAPVADITTEADVRKVINLWHQTLRNIATFILEKDPANPIAYRYRRIAAWSQVNVLPPATDGQTEIPPPTPQVIQPLTELRNNGNHQALLVSAEQRLSQSIFWLDLNRWVVESLAGLGAEYQRAQEAVRQETAYLLHRLPGLEALSFSDGTPLADPDTKRWLKGIEFGAAGVPAGPTPLPEGARGEGGRGQQTETIDKALALANKKKLVEAVQLLQKKLKNCFSKKEELMWRLALCQILIGSQRTEMALPHLHLILTDIDTFQLTSWDPELALKGYKVVWTGFSSHTDKELKKNADTILNRIAELDPVEALALTK
jgi:type VI secretion system protein VasJ